MWGRDNHSRATFTARQESILMLRPDAVRAEGLFKFVCIRCRVKPITFEPCVIVIRIQVTGTVVARQQHDRSRPSFTKQLGGEFQCSAKSGTRGSAIFPT